MVERTLTHSEARRFYDRFGAKQDRQGWYEDAPLARLIELGQFSSAKGVVELGCGTGKFAARLLSNVLAADASYLGVDLSSTMVGLAAERTERFGQRARVEQVEGGTPLRIKGVTLPERSCDRFVSTYVLDLLAESEIERSLKEGWRLLEPGGLLCLVSLAPGDTPVSSWVSRLWTVVHRLRPSLVGGCRPVELAARLGPPDWHPPRSETVLVRGLTSEVVVAQKPRNEPGSTTADS